MKDLLDLINSDLHRLSATCSLKKFMYFYFLSPGFKYLFWFRIFKYLKNKMPFLYILFYFYLRRLQYKYGYDIPASTDIGKGFYIGHFGGIVVNGKTKIGNNCNISQNVTIGYNARGKFPGIPILGDEIYIGPGAKIFDGIIIGSNVAIGANAVVNFNVPNNSVVVGNPGKITSNKGSEGYILNKYI